ncbi:MAG: type II toxin-antitoxin system ParD family antitoxin [Candidatus Eremiobacteraeota bacterium]|nr:type II toxin-antitoxin system ParD family antitoxin [Candidatus Eremiobacteraeota bacterium]
MAKNANAGKVGTMGAKNISLPSELEAYIDAKVASGEYAHASEVVREGVRLLMEEARKLEWLRTAIAEADADIAAGRTYSSAEVRKELAKLRKTRTAVEKHR